MDIISTAAYLINRAVKMASDLDQNTRDHANRPVNLRSSREKSTGRLGDAAVAPRKSSAYRVSISNAAIQKMASQSPI